jgi:hypothetical protein
MGAKLDQYFVNYHRLKERGEDVSHYESSLPKEVDIKAKHFAQHLLNKAKEREITPEVAEMVEKFMRDIPEIMAHMKAMREREAHEREVEKAREEQGFAKAREDAMGKAVVDFSKVFGEGPKPAESVEALKATGLGIHMVAGETHPRARFTEADIQQLRRDYWASDRKRGEVSTLAKRYDMRRETAHAIIRRKNWVHLPRVEGEPEENLKNLSQQEIHIANRAKALGVEPVRSELGRLALPPDAVAKLRAEKKAAKKSAAGE